MPTAKQLCLTILAAASVAALATGASAQSGRDQAMHRCLQQAQAQFPGTSSDASIDRNRTSVYKSCMTRSGFAP